MEHQELTEKPTPNQDDSVTAITEIQPRRVTWSGLRLAATNLMRWSAKAVLVALALVGLSFPVGPTPWFNTAIFGLPLLWALTRPRASWAFRYWASYALALSGFVVFRAHAYSITGAVFTRYPVVLGTWLGLGEPIGVRLQHWFFNGTIRWHDRFMAIVHLSHFWAPPLVAFVLWRWAPTAFRKYVLALIITLAVGLVTHALAPTAPPWMVLRGGHSPWAVTRILSLMLPPGGVYMDPNPWAAMPSMHEAVAVAGALAIAQAWPRLTRIAWAYAALMGIALVYLGEHFVVDVLAGTGLAMLSWYLVGVLVTSSDQRVTETPVGRTGRPSRGEEIQELVI